MGYRIEYKSDSTVDNKVETKTRPYFRIFSICMVVLLLLTLFPSFRSTLRDVILPGNDEVTASALNGLAENLHEGVSLNDAIKVFCAEIVDNGENKD